MNIYSLESVCFLWRTAVQRLIFDRIYKKNLKRNGVQAAIQDTGGLIDFTLPVRWADDALDCLIIYF